MFSFELNEMSCYLCSAVVLLGEKRNDSGCDDVAGPVGGAARCLQQFGTWPHELQVWLTKVMLAVWNNIELSQLHRHVDATDGFAFGLHSPKKLQD